MSNPYDCGPALNGCADAVTTKCSDGIDNDCDGTTDLGDANCTRYSDDDEGPEPPKCDGQCCELPPEGPPNILPTGSFDAVNAGNSGLAQGWTFDPDSPNTNLEYRVYISWNTVNTDPAPGCPNCNAHTGNYTNVVRSDVDAVYGLAPGTRGFNYTIPEVYRDGGLHYINIYAVDANNGTLFKLVPTRAFILDLKPIGSFDEITAGGVAGGWTLDADTQHTNIEYHVYISNDAACTVNCVGYPGNHTGMPRPDVDAAYGISPAGNHGFNFTIPPAWYDGILHYMSIYGVNSASPGGGNTFLTGSPRSFTFAPPVGSIQGYKIKMPGNTFATPPNDEPLVLDETFPLYTNPYYFLGISPGSHTIRTGALPTGWLVGYTLCYNSTACHNNTPTMGSTVTVNVPSNGYVDLYWHYYPPPTGTITTITSPRSSILTSNGSPLGTIAGTASDGIGVTDVQVVIRRGSNPFGVCDDWNGSAWTGGCFARQASFTPGTSPAWTTSAPPAVQMIPGQYTIFVDVINTKGQHSGWVPNVSIQYTNSNPTVSSVRVTEPNYCASAPSAFIEWAFADPDGDAQSVYRIQIDDDAAFGSPLMDTGDISCASCRSFLSPSTLAFNTIYHARVATLDSGGGASGWQNMSLCTGPGCQPGNTSWRTPLHAYPSGVDFTWTPPNPSVNQVVNFSGAGICYTVGNVVTPCTSWSWTFGDGGTASIKNPPHTYTVIGAYNATLQATDAQGFTCPLTPAGHTVNLQTALPTWVEVAPR